jgi:hypothetical protein
MELFNPCNGDIYHELCLWRKSTINLLVLTLLVDSCPNLSAADDESPDFFFRFDLEFVLFMSGISKDTMEVIAFAEMLKR